MGVFNRRSNEKGSDHSPEPGIGHGEVDGMAADNRDQLQRHLANRQIQLIAIGGSIGTALFVSIGGGLYRGGPGNLLIAFTLQSCILAMVNNSIAEMNTAYPVSGGFIRLAGKWVDDALGFMVGWNFLLVYTCQAVDTAKLTRTVFMKPCLFPSKSQHLRLLHHIGVKLLLSRVLLLALWPASLFFMRKFLN